MMHAERRGKLGADAGRAHDRAEDLLTSTVFQLLRYLPPADWLPAVFGRTHRVMLDGSTADARPDGGWIPTAGATSCRYEFWPKWGRDEPDLWLTLVSRGRPSAYVLIEAKLHSPKSRLAVGPAADESSDRPDRDPDQLVRYWCGLERRAGAVPARLVYLTAHSSPPLAELGESLRRHTTFAPAGPLMQLGWLSWRDIWQAVGPLAAKRRPARDLRRLLAHKGLTHFEGFTGSTWRPPTGPAGYWTGP